MESKIDFLSEISNFIFTDKYARYNDLMSRRETWDECVSRVEKMHVNKFKKILSDSDLKQIEKAFTFVREKKVAPSMRSMQFAGKAIDAHQSKIYNCSVRHIDSVRAFSESFYMLLCGNGVGFGLSKFFLNRLPNLVGPKDKTGTVITYTIQDSVEGWADSLEALLNCYLKNTAYSGRKIVFDYSRIRPEGTPLKTSGGKAPGYKGLKRTHKKIKDLLDYIIEDLHQVQLAPINAYDILMHCADAVLSGGIRRSACIAIFDKDDEVMLNCKTNYTVTKYNNFSLLEKSNKYEGTVYIDGKFGGKKNTKYEVVVEEWEFNQIKKDKTISWNHIEPQRARSNNSVLLLRNSTTREEFLNLNKLTRQWGEPGFIFADHPWVLANPCFDRNTRIATNKGLTKIIDLVNTNEEFTTVTDNRISRNSFDVNQRGISTRKASKVVLTQKNANLYKVTTEHGHTLTVTDNHTFITPDKGRLQLKDLVVGDKILLQSSGVFGTTGTYNDGLMLGSITGDGTFAPNKRTATTTSMSIWEDDFDVLDDFLQRLHVVIKDVPNQKSNHVVSWNPITEGFNNKSGMRLSSTQLFKYFQNNLNISSPVSIKSRVPECIWQGSEEMVKGYLHGIIFTDGSVNLKCASKGSVSTLNIEISQSNELILQDIQILLQNFGITSRLYKLNDAREWLLPDGKGSEQLYDCKAAFRLSINRPNSIKLLNAIGLYGRKQKILEDLLKIRGITCNKPERYTTKIKSIEFSHIDDVFCFTEPETNSTIANGLAVGQCVEIQFLPVTADGVCGAQNCNLSTNNGAKIKTQKDFIDAVWASTLIGTLQAAYTDFKYLGKASKSLTEEEALLGVSVTGFMDSPEITLKPENQREAALYALKTNEEWAAKLGIKPAARITCVKPEGCLSPDTDIKTSLGVKSIKDIFELNGYNLDDYKNIKSTFLECSEKIQVKDHNNNWQYITNLYINGISDVFDIELEDGTIVSATPNHKFMVEGKGWVRVDELLETDNILSYSDKIV